VQDIKHREWPATRKLDKGHVDCLAATADIEFTFSGRLTKPDPTAPLFRPLLGSSDLCPVAADNSVLRAPASCRNSNGRAAVIERAFRGEKLEVAEVCFV
jgi:hypothetical protein